MYNKSVVLLCGKQNDRLLSPYLGNVFYFHFQVVIILLLRYRVFSYRNGTQNDFNLVCDIMYIVM